MDSSPCREANCRECCVGTSMTLTEADRRRLEARGHTGFYRLTGSCDLQLVNRAGRCVFLAEDGCSVYDDRPEGCRLYPLILDSDRDRVMLDGFCPQAQAFPTDARAEAQLRRSVETERLEAAQRLATRDPWEA